MVVFLSDGSEYEKTVLIPLGDAAKPLSWQDIREKLHGCSEGLLSENQQDRLMENILSLEKAGGTNYKVYTMDHLTILDGLEPKGKRHAMIRHITVNSKHRYAATDTELHEIAKELLPQGTPYKIKKSFFMKSVAHIYEEN